MLSDLKYRGQVIMKNFKDKIKGFIVGALVCSLMFGTVAFAASTKISVTFDKIKYMFDGVEKKPTDAQGFIYKGTVYAPISFIGKSVGKDVAYDGKTKTVWVGKKLGSFKYLDSIEYARFDTSSTCHTLSMEKWDSSNFKIAGNTFLHGIGSYFSWGLENPKQSIDYNLDGKYKTIYGKIGIDDISKNSTEGGRIKILGDGEEIYVSDLLKGGDLPRDLNVDISGVLKLQIVFEGDNYDRFNIVFGDAKLIQ